MKSMLTVKMFSVKTGATLTLKAMAIAASAVTLAVALSASSGASAQSAAAPPYPGKRTPGASRSICPSTPLNITAFVPENDARVSTKTTEDRPIVWVYVPFDQSVKTKVAGLELRVTDASGKVAKQTIPLPAQAGIMPIELPSEVKLEVGQSYRWSLRAKCSSNAPFDIQLTIDRVAALPKQPLPTSTSQANVEFYDKNGIWLNTMTEVIKLNGGQPKLTIEAQTFLLKKLDGSDFKMIAPDYLKDITQQPIVD